MVGKWHLKSEPTGFDYWKVLSDQGDYYQPEFRTSDGLVTVQGYASDVITDYALDFLKEKGNDDKPFLLMYQHKAPHREWMPSQDYLDEFMDQPIPAPQSLFDDYKNAHQIPHGVQQ